MNFNYDIGLIDTILTLDTTQAPPLGGQTGVLVIVGDGAVALPSGVTGVRPATPVGGMLRFNNDAPLAGLLEYYDGTTWQTLAASSGSVSSVTVTTGTGLEVSGGSSQTITSSGTFAFVLDEDLEALSALAGTGFITRTGAGTFAQRSITGTAGNIVVTNGDGIAASPTIDLATVTDSGSGTFQKVTVDSYGRVTGTEAVVQGDITALVDSVYVNVAGDTMTGNLDMGNFYITQNNPPVTDTQLANKAYVDSVAAGLSWKQAVRAASTGNLTLATTTAVDGVTLVTGDRVLVKNQTTTAENGIYEFDGTGLVRVDDMDAAAEFAGATVFVTEGTANADTGWTQTAEVVTVGTDPVVWSQFSGSNTYTWGDGLTITGNTISVNMGAGITVLPTDEVGIDLFAPTSGALILTTDGSTTSTVTGAQLHLLLDAAGGLTQSATGLAIAAAGVTNAMLVNDSITIDVDGVGTTSVDLGGTIGIFGTTNRVTTSVVGSDVVVDISANYAGQTSITTVGTITTGTWNGDIVGTSYGGTGLDTSAAANGQLLIGTGSGLALATLTAGTGISIVNGSGSISISNTGVTSVALAAPSIFTVSGSPVTTTGTLTLDLATQVAGTVFAGPVSGGDAAPTFRALAYSDLPLELYVENPVTPVAPVASGTNSVAVGSGASATQYGSIAFANGGFGTAGSAQHGNYILRTTTSDNAFTEMFLDGSSAQFVVPVNSVVTFSILISGRRTDDVGGGAGYKVEGVVRRDTSTASVALIGSPSKTVLGETNAPWDVQVNVDTATGALRVYGRGENAKTVRWVAVMQTAEVTN